MASELHLYLLLAACVPLVPMIVGLSVLKLRRDINAKMLAEYLVKLHRGSPERAVKLCGAALCPATTLGLYLLGLEEPATVVERRAQEGGYRDAGAQVREVPFAERAAALADRELRALARSQLRRYGLAATLGGLLAFLVGAVAWVLFPPAGLRPSWLDAAPLVGLLGAAFGLRLWQRVVAGLRVVAAALLPLLRPVEEMSPEYLAAAKRARAAHEERQGAPSRPG